MKKIFLRELLRKAHNAFFAMENFTDQHGEICVSCVMWQCWMHEECGGSESEGYEYEISANVDYKISFV